MPRPLAFAVAFLAAAAMAGPAASLDEPRLSEPPGDWRLPDSPGEMHLPEALERALRELMEELKPALDDAVDFMRSFEVIDDPRNYELPEILPNGDIIIRRRDDAPPFRPDGTDPDLLPEPEEGVRT